MNRPDEPAYAQERAFPRILYPSHRRPYLLTRTEICEVVDCSEQGIRFAGAVEMPAVGTLISARIRFRSGGEVAVRGCVVRIQHGEVALSLEPGHGIPAGVLSAEETWLRNAAEAQD